MRNETLPRVCGVLRWACLGVMIVLPAVILAAAVSAPELTFPMARANGLYVAPDVSAMQLWAAFAVGLLPVAALIWTLNQMRQLFSAYDWGDVLTPRSAHRIRGIGQGFLALALVPLIVQPLQSVLLSWNNAAGERQVSVGLSSDMLGFAFVSGLLIVIGWAMGQAAEVAAENKAFV